jgi:hypothetical protein
VCDVAENCTGSGANCPADGFQPSSTQCRASAGVCDVAENCTGSGAACPADAFAPSSQVCRPSADLCDATENCTGSGAACPADGPKPAGTVCRPAANDCDIVEQCNGSSFSCPADAVDPDGTPCTDGTSCTTGDLCQSGQCVGTTDLDLCMDDFTCYSAKPTTFFTRIQNIALEDEWEIGNFYLSSIRHLCNPTNKNNEGLLDPDTHIETYQAKHSPGSPRHQRRNWVRSTSTRSTSTC